MFCPYCGKDAENAKFCPNCGKPLVPQTITTHPGQSPQNVQQPCCYDNQVSPKKQNKGTSHKIVAIILLSIAAFFLIMTISFIQLLQAIDLIFLCITVAFAVPGFIQLYKSSLYRKGLNQTAPLSLPLLAGIPLPEKTPCLISINSSNMNIAANGTNFSIPMECITALSIMSNSDFQQHAVSSVGGAVAGDLLFGPIGAIIGGRSKIKTTVKRTNYFIVTYTKDNTVSYIGFYLKPNINTRVKVLVANFNSSPHRNRNVSL